MAVYPFKKPTPHDPSWQGYSLDTREARTDTPRRATRPLTSDERSQMAPPKKRDRLPVWTLITAHQPKSSSVSSLTPKESRAADVAAFEAKTRRDRESALEFRKTRRPVAEVPQRPGMLPDEVLAR
jgi:hypothetical protein